MNSSGGSSTTQNLTPGQTCSISSPDNANWLARCAAAPNLATYTVSALPSASIWGAGAQVAVTDGTGTPPTCTGGGTVGTVPYQIAISNGTTWSCH
jgi:hypothetical protein